MLGGGGKKSVANNVAARSRRNGGDRKGFFLLGVSSEKCSAVAQRGRTVWGQNVAKYQRKMESARSEDGREMPELAGFFN